MFGEVISIDAIAKAFVDASHADQVRFLDAIGDAYGWGAGLEGDSARVAHSLSPRGRAFIKAFSNKIEDE